jgi:starch phosphorylase
MEVPNTNSNTIEELKEVEDSKEELKVEEKTSLQPDISGVIPRRSSKFDLLEEPLLRPAFIYQKKESPKDMKMWDLMKSYIKSDKASIKKHIVSHVEHTFAQTRFDFDNTGCYYATAYSLRDRLVESWNDTYQQIFEKDNKCIYYMSMEYLLGRMLQNTLTNLGLEHRYKEVLEDMGYKLEEIYEEENDPGLGNGGLGRLAACFLDSLTTLGYPAWGYSIRYNYGIFKQVIHHGCQVELPDYWLARGNPWEIERLDVIVPIQFYGSVKVIEENGVKYSVWEGTECVQAMAYDLPIPGYNTFSTNNLRLWRACPSTEFDFKLFNTGDYFGAVKAKQKAESISSVLYPNDATFEGKELRLKQEYFFCAATLRDILNRFLLKHKDWNELPKKVSIQLNDTHPALTIIELVRLLIDEYKVTWEQSWKVTSEVFSYTNHTVMPEALEKWDVELMVKLLPRHMEIIYLVNYYLLESIREMYPEDGTKVESMSLIEEGNIKRVRMANLCIVGSHKVNGVAKIHTELIKNWLFKDFNDYYKKLDNKKEDKFINITNGVTPRRWMLCTNPQLSELITQKLSHNHWITDLSLLVDFKNFKEDEDTLNQLANIKKANKLKLAEWVKKNCHGFEIDSTAMFDVFVKRIHEYKRQLMAILYIVYRFLCVKEMTNEQKANVVPRVFLIGGKAAPGYDSAKKTIKLVNMVANIVNNDKDIGNLLKVVFMPNYSVSNAQIIIPAADISQHISTAGTEASGTSNMKFAMNGCLIIGTMDGANIEIAEEIGKENMFVFGRNIREVEECRKQMAEGKRDYAPLALRKVFTALFDGNFGNLNEMKPMLNKLIEGEDQYLVCWDFESYIEAQTKVDECYKDQKKWLGKAITSIAYSGKFSTDRTINEYADSMW